MLKLALAATATLAMSLVGGCFVVANVVTAEETRVSTMPTADTVSLDINTSNGTVDVAAAPDRRDVSIESRLVAGGSTAQEAKDRLALAKVEATVSNGVLTIRPIFPDPANPRDGASFTVRLPAITDARIESSNGKIIVADASGSLRLYTSNGLIRARNVRGEVEADSSNGAIELSGVGGKIKANTSNGHIHVELGEGSHAPMTLMTSNGRIEIALPCTYVGTLNLTTSNGGISVDDRCGSTIDRDVKETKGTVRLGAPDDTSPVSTASTSNGRISVVVGH